VADLRDSAVAIETIDPREDEIGLGDGIKAATNDDSPRRSCFVGREAQKLLLSGYPVAVVAMITPVETAEERPNIIVFAKDRLREDWPFGDEFDPASWATAEVRQGVPKIRNDRVSPTVAADFPCEVKTKRPSVGNCRFARRFLHFSSGALESRSEGFESRFVNDKLEQFRGRPKPFSGNPGGGKPLVQQFLFRLCPIHCEEDYQLGRVTGLKVFSPSLRILTPGETDLNEVFL
jgi:hypothetical protein